MTPMNIVFMGSSCVACVMLERLLSERFVTLAGVVSQPDRPSGRRLRATPCEVAGMARARGLALHTPADVNSRESLAWITARVPDVIVVTAYGQILGESLLAIPRLGCLNIHLSLLPSFRGAAPVQRAILAGCSLTGVSAMCMDAGMDSGPVLMRKEEPILDDDTAGTLEHRLALCGAEILPKALEALQIGHPPAVPQDRRKVSFAPKLRKSDGEMDWSQSAFRLERFVRAMNPWPVAYTYVPRVCRGSSGGRLRIWQASAEECEPAGPAGSVLDANAEGPLVAAGEGALRLNAVQPAGGRWMPGGAFCRGHVLERGWLFGKDDHDENDG